MIPTFTVVIAISTALAATAAAEPPREQLVSVTNVTKRANRTAAESAAKHLVEHHFEALAAGDTAALSKIWSPSATVQSTAVGGTPRVVPIATALRVWLDARRGFRGSINWVRSRGDRVIVDATGRWNGARYHDLMVVSADEHGVPRILSKSTSRIDREARAGTGYGG